MKLNLACLKPLLTVAAVTLLLPSCGLTRADGGPILISVEREIEIGGQVHDSIVSETPLLTDPVIVGYVDALGQQLAAVSSRPTLLHRFYVLDTEVINAFAAPGGFLYVTVGLLRKLNSRAELAGVLGHEVGHISGFHGVKELEDSAVAGLVTSWILGDESVTGQVVEVLLNIYKNTAHSRELELEADELGITFAYEAGYNPWGLVNFFELLAALVQSDPISDFLSSHPAPTERVQLSSKQIEALGVSKTAPIIDDSNAPFIAWEELQARLP